MVARRRTPGSARPDDHRHASRTLPSSDVTSISPSKPSRRTASKSIPGAHFTTSVAIAVDVEQPVQRRHVVARVEPSPPDPLRGPGRASTTASRVTGRSASARHSATSRTIVSGHRQPDRVDVAAHDEVGRVPQRRKLGADRTGDVVHDARLPAGAARCSATACGGGLLQRLVGEQPVRRGRRTWPPPCGAAASSRPARRRARRIASVPRRCRRPGWRRSAGSRRPRAAPALPSSLRQIGDVVEVERLRRLDPGDHDVVEPALGHDAAPDVVVDPGQRRPAAERELRPAPAELARAAPSTRRCVPASPASRR